MLAQSLSVTYAEQPLITSTLIEVLRKSLCAFSVLKSLFLGDFVFVVGSQSHLRFTRNCNTDAHKYNERAKNGDGAHVTAPFKVASNTPTHRRMLAEFDAIRRSDSVAWNASRYLLPSISKTAHNTCIFFFLCGNDMLQPCTSAKILPLRKFAWFHSLCRGV